MGQLKAQHRHNGFAGQTLDFLKVSFADQVLIYHPAAAAGDDFIKGKIGIQVLGVDAAGGHELHAGIGSRHGFDHIDAAGCFGREELNNVQTQGNCGFHIAGIGRTGRNGNVLGNTVFDNLRIQAGADNEFGAGRNGTVNLLGGQDGACADQHLGEFFRHNTDGFFSRCGTEGYLRAGQAAFAKSLGQRRSVLGVIQHNDRNDTDFLDLF